MCKLHKFRSDFSTFKNTQNHTYWPLKMVRNGLLGHYLLDQREGCRLLRKVFHEREMTTILSPVSPHSHNPHLLVRPLCLRRPWYLFAPIILCLFGAIFAPCCLCAPALSIPISPLSSLVFLCHYPPVSLRGSSAAAPHFYVSLLPPVCLLPPPVCLRPPPVPLLSPSPADLTHSIVSCSLIGDILCDCRYSALFSPSFCLSPLSFSPVCTPPSICTNAAFLLSLSSFLIFMRTLHGTSAVCLFWNTHSPSLLSLSPLRNIPSLTSCTYAVRRSIPCSTHLPRVFMPNGVKGSDDHPVSYEPVRQLLGSCRFTSRHPMAHDAHLRDWLHKAYIFRCADKATDCRESIRRQELQKRYEKRDDRATIVSYRHIQMRPGFLKHRRSAGSSIVLYKIRSHQKKHCLIAPNVFNERRTV